MVTKTPDLPSLRTFIPLLAEWMEITVDQIYERQRQLVAAKILKPRSGRGPGSGVPTTPKNIAILLLAVLVGYRIKGDFIDDVRAFIAVKPESGACPFTG